MNDQLRALFQSRFEQSLEVKRQTLALLLPEMVAAAESLLASYRAGGKAILFGNGGSAADAQHLAAEFVGRFQVERSPLPALALNVNTSALTAIGNDYGYEQVFARQLQALGRPGDVAIGLTTSGNSANVLAAFATARAAGIATIGLTGQGGGKLRQFADIVLAVPSTETPRIQECHILIGHTLCEAVERALTAG